MLGDWTKRVIRLWSQDDAVPDEDTPARAWRRLFGGSLPAGRSSWIAHVDHGDADSFLDAQGRVYVSSYPGACEIGVLRGSRASVLPRLIISGGQTGADRGAMDGALALGFPIGGWAPEGWLAEDGQIPEPYRSRMVELRRDRDEERLIPTRMQVLRDRTIANIYDGDGTLILSSGKRLGGGSAMTKREAEQRRKHVLHLTIGDPDGRGEFLRADQPRAILAWIREHRIGVLNVAGPRESKEPGIQALAGEVIRGMLSLVEEEKAQIGDLARDLDLSAPPFGGAAGQGSPADDHDEVDERDAIDERSDLERSQIDIDEADDAVDLARSMSDQEYASIVGVDLAVQREVAPSGSFQPSADQEAAALSVSRWMADPGAPQIYRLFGAAGTGKTTLVRSLVAGSSRPWLFASYTGKAALVMRQKGCPNAQTIHSLIYRPDDGRKSAEVIDHERSPELSFRLHDQSPLRWSPGVAIDECSMVDSEIGGDLLSFRKKILVCGDKDQLPPIAGAGFFTSGDPDFLLTEVHRQARDSGILDLATHVREGGALWDRVGWRSESGDCEVVSRGSWTAAQIMGRMSQADQVIVGTNRTRHQFNDRHRRIAGIESPLPVVGDKVICLRNERKAGLLNGSRWRVLEVSTSHDGRGTLAGSGAEGRRGSIDRRTVEMRLATEDGTSPGEVTVRSWADHFLGRERQLDELGPMRMSRQEFDFGYYVTCHKAQGSQWDDVVLYDESGVFNEDTRRRWLYTGITRAAKRILVIA